MMAGSEFTGSSAGLVGKTGMDALLESRKGRMPTERLNMRRVRVVLRLEYTQGLGKRQIAALLGFARRIHP